MLALKVLLEDIPVRDCVVILRNDCASALAALEKGSRRSTQLQAASVELHKGCIARGIFPRFLHDSGKRLIEERVDEGTREHARALKGPGCGPVLLDIVKGFVAEQGWNPTIVFFASAYNHVTERYMS